MPVEKFSLYLWGYEYLALCLLSIQNSMPIELIVFILTLTCGHATSSSSADAEDGLLRSTTVNGETRIGADRDTILCRSCGKGLADPHFLHTSQLSPEFLARRNHTSLFGSEKAVSVEKLRNPHGVEFEIVSFDKAGCRGIGNWEKEGTWFPGFLWRVCICPKCQTHVGWMFEPEDLLEKKQDRPSQAGFYGIILKKVIDEDFAHTVTISGNNL